MSNNRPMISDLDLVSPALLLDKGLPIPGLRGRITVDDGWCSVITVGGAFKEILGPGQYSLDRYDMWRDVKATRVDTRVKTLTVSTVREFVIALPVPIEINLDLSVEYRVADPRRVALEISTPLTSLYDRVYQAVRGAVANATIDEIRTQGEWLARTTLQRLQALQLPATIGLEVLTVMVTTIKATDAGSDAIARLQFDQLQQIEKARLDAALMTQSQPTMSWLIQTGNPLASQILELAAKYGVEANDLLAKMLGSSPTAPAAPPSIMGRAPAYPGAPAVPALPASRQDSGRDQGSGDVHSRMREEVDLLTTLPGARIETRPGFAKSGIPDGSYLVTVDIPRISRGVLKLYFECPAGYPDRTPRLDVEVDGQATPFPSGVLRRWSGRGQYLVEVVREVKQYFG